MWKHLLACVVATLMIGTATAAPPQPGIWKLAIARNVDADVAVCLVQLANDNNKWTATMAARNPLMGKVVVEGMEMDDRFLRLRMQVSDEPVVFEGVLTGDDKKFRGSYGNDQRLVIASLIPTTEERIDRDSMLVPRETPVAVKQYLDLETERLRLLQLLVKSGGTDHDRIKDLCTNHQRKMDEQLPPLFATILKDHLDHSASCDIGLSLVQAAYRSDTKADQVHSWVQATLKSAEQFGPRYRRDVLLRLVESVHRHDAVADLAFELAKEAEQGLGPIAPPWLQAKVLALLVDSAIKAKKVDAAKPFQERLEKLESGFDAELQKRLPKWEIKPYEKRAKPKANQVAMVELFTSSEAPPCVAADFACEKLMERFRPTEVIVLNYYLNTFAPDALANADTQARHDFYSASHSQHANTLPAIFINGFPRAAGGGPLSQAKKKYDELLPFIYPVLDAEIEAKLDFEATRAGDKITLKATTHGMADEPEGLKLRMAIVEDAVPYAGGNGLRLHRNVVRAMPGSADGIALTKASEKQEQVVDLANLRTKIRKHLDDYAKEEMPYPRPYPAMYFKKLKAVAWVQDDRRRQVHLAKCVEIGE